MDEQGSYEPTASRLEEGGKTCGLEWPADTGPALKTGGKTPIWAFKCIGYSDRFPLPETENL